MNMFLILLVVLSVCAVLSAAGSSSQTFSEPRWETKDSLGSLGKAAPPRSGVAAGLSTNSPVPKHSTKFVAECNMPTENGQFRMRSYNYKSEAQTLEPIVMVSGDVGNKENVLVRVHDQCFTSEVFGSLRCDCKLQLKQSLDMIQKESEVPNNADQAQGGIVIYLQQEGRGIGIANKVAAYALQDQGMDTVDANLHLGFAAEQREYKCVPDILRDLGIKSIRLMTNNPFKIEQLRALGVEVTDRVSIQMPANPHNERYLQAKKDRMRHLLAESPTLVASAPIDQAATRTFTRKMKLPGAVGMLRGAGSARSEDEVAPKVGLAGGNAASVMGMFPTAIAAEKPKSKAAAHIDGVNAVESERGYALGRDTVLAAIEATKQGKVVLVVDDADRENEGDLIMAAEKATPEAVGFIVRYSSGVLCVSLEGERLDALRLPPMVQLNQDPKQTAYSVSADYKHGTSTGISAADRALTFRKLVDPTASADEFQRPGHVFPLRYKPGGTLRRKGHTEASLDLSRLAGLAPGGVLAEVVHDDGSMMRLPALRDFGKQHNLVLTSVQDIAAYRRELEEKQ